MCQAARRAGASSKWLLLLLVTGQLQEGESSSPSVHLGRGGLPFLELLGRSQGRGSFAELHQARDQPDATRVLL